MSNFSIDNPLQTLAQSGLLGVLLDDNAPPAANVIYSSLKSGGGGITPPATTTSLGTIQLAGALTGTATSPQLAPGAVTSGSIAPGSLPATVLVPNSITSAQLAAGSVTGGLGGTIAANTITSTELAPNAVTNTAIANGAVTYSKMQNISQPALLGNSLVPGGPVTEITMGSGLSLTAVPGTLSIDPITLPQATSSAFGVIKLGGDLAGSGSTASSPIITAASVTYGSGGKLQNASAGNILLGNSTGASGPIIEVPLTVGGGLQFSGGSLGVNLGSITGGSPLSVSAGGTGASTLAAGYLRGNGTSTITSVSTIPASDITPNLVGSVNGNLPTGPGGNVTVLIGSVTTGTSSTPPVVVPANGSIYVVSGGLPADNGRTYISDGTAWNEVTSNQAATDARYVQLAGSTMSAGAILTFPATGRVVLNQASFAATDAVTKNYVDAQVAAGAPDATTSVKGIVQLAGDLTGVATAPLIGTNKITYPKIQQVSQKALLGNQGPGAANVSEIQIDTTTGIDIIAGKLSIDPTNLPQATALQFGTIKLGGDLAGTGSTASAPIITTNSVQYSKLQQSLSPNIVLGQMTSGQNITELSVSGGITVGASSLKLSDLSGAGQLLGSVNGPAPFSPTSIILGPSMSMTTNQLNSAVSFFSGVDPNLTSPTDRPSSSNVVYIGTNGSVWIWNGSVYTGIVIGSTVAQTVALNTDVVLGTLKVRVPQFNTGVANSNIFISFNDGNAHQINSIAQNQFYQVNTNPNVTLGRNFSGSISATPTNINASPGDGQIQFVGGYHLAQITDITFTRQWNVTVIPQSTTTMFISISRVY